MSRFGLMVASLVAAFVVGCGGGADGPRLHTVEGTVQLDGAALAEGNIIFKDPAGQLPSYFAAVKEGKYKTEVQAGKWRVEIGANRANPAKMVPNAEGTGMEPTVEQYLPARYNEQSTLELEVPAESNRSQNYELESK